MYSLDEFYIILEKNLLEPMFIQRFYFYPYGSYSSENFVVSIIPRWATKDSGDYKRPCMFQIDQEPIFEDKLADLITDKWFGGAYSVKILKILAHSEHSESVKRLCKDYSMNSWYYFFHGFAALHWYAVFKHLPKIDYGFSKVFIALNHLVTKDRSYRLNLVARLMESDILHHGLVSCQLEDSNGTWKQEIFSPNSLLSLDSKKLIAKHFAKMDKPLTVDQTPHGMLSAELDIDLMQQALWHVVTETIFYHDKLHLTEKIFKPIVARRPFMLVGAVGNLAYLKSYGFKTFDRWVDESYDLETNPDKRIQMIVNELTRLSAMSHEELKNMHSEMQEILNFNFDHFYNGFKVKIVNELVDNFEACLNQYNVGRIGDKRMDTGLVDYAAVKRLMLLP